MNVFSECILKVLMCYNYKKILAKMLGSSRKLDLMGKPIDISGFIFQNSCLCLIFWFLIKSNLINTAFLKL